MPLGASEITWLELRRAAMSVPDPVVSVLVFAAAVIAGLLAQRAIEAVLHRSLVHRPLLKSLLSKLEGPLRLAVVILALNIAVSAAPLDQDLTGALAHILQVAFIAMIGWLALSALNIAAEIYLRRFDIEAEDNLLARKQVTQVRVLKGAINILIVTVTIAAVLMTFEQVRQYGVSLFASAGIAGIVVGFAARPMLSNLIAGVQLAITQPIRVDDAVIVEGEWGRVEDVTATYVVIRLWDWRRLIVPLSYFIEKPFQNWTRENASLIGPVLLRVDLTAPVDRIRAKAEEFVRGSKLWDGRVLNVQVTDCDASSMEVRVLASAANSGAAFDLRCELREKLLAFLARELPKALPHRRHRVATDGEAAAIDQLDEHRQQAVRRNR